MPGMQLEILREGEFATHDSYAAAEDIFVSACSVSPQPCGTRNS
jgi:hypothetical protein